MSNSGRLARIARILDRSGGGAILRGLPAWRGLLVLNYHRIGDPLASPLDRDVFSATAEAFGEQMAFLKLSVDVLDPNDLGAFLDRGRGRAVLVTFDDGYRDNHELALPVLTQLGLPAVFFLCTQFLDDGMPAWWDEIAWMVRSSRLTGTVAFPAVDPAMSLRTEDRDQTIRACLRTFKGLPSDRTAAFLAELAVATGSGRMGHDESRTNWMTWEMARELDAAGVRVGAHTVNHPVLARLPITDQTEEMARSAVRIMAELGRRPRLFAYPVGGPDTFTEETKGAVAALGFDFAFSFHGGAQPFAPLDRFAIRRAHVGVDYELAHFKAMVTMPALFARW